jgi:putative membrane protein
MLITKNIRISRILINTWKVDLIMIVSCTITYFTREFLITHNLDIPPIIPSVLGTAIAFFIGFNNNQAYDRWWEARKIWGSLVNNSRSWARGLFHYVDKNEESEAIFRRMIHRHLSFLYALKGTLRSFDDQVYKKYLPSTELVYVETHTNKQNAILNLQAQDLQQLSKKGFIDSFRFIELNTLLVNFTDDMGMSERIKNTVFPLPTRILPRFLSGSSWFPSLWLSALIWMPGQYLSVGWSVLYSFLRKSTG